MFDILAFDPLFGPLNHSGQLSFLATESLMDCDQNSKLWRKILQLRLD